MGASVRGRRIVSDAVGVIVTDFRPGVHDVVFVGAVESVWSARRSERVRPSEALTVLLSVRCGVAVALITPRGVRVTPLAVETVRNGVTVAVSAAESEREIDAALVAEGEAEGIDEEAEIVEVLPMVAVAVGSAIG